MNPWHEKLGCEVNVCRAANCTHEFMRVCALRKAWQDRMAYLRIQLHELGGNRAMVRIVQSKIDMMRDYDREEIGAEQAD